MLSSCSNNTPIIRTIQFNETTRVGMNFDFFQTNERTDSSICHI